MLKIGLISNPGSERNRRGFDDVRAAAAGVPDLVHRVADGAQSLGEILADLARREIGLLVISGGDGTVQRLLTELLETRPFERLPPVAILARGMANMTAGDVGLRGRSTSVLPRLVEAARKGDLAGHVQHRYVLRVDNIRDRPAQRGMFFGAGAIYDAIEFCCSRVYSVGLKGNLGMGLTLAGFLLRGLFGPIRGHDIAITLDDRPVSRARRLLVLATTLDRLVLGSRPFWAAGSERIRFTSIAHPPQQLIRSAPKVLYGWRRATLPENCYVSGGAERLSLGLDSAFTLDGEPFEPDPQAPLVVTAPDRVAFVRL